MNKKVTIYDIAKKANVSPATVSRVINEPEKVGLEKRTHVLKIIQDFDFVPKAEAVANARKLYHKIGVIAPFFTAPSYMERLRGISEVLSGLHYELVIYAIDAIPDLNMYIESLVSNHKVDGLIILCMQFNKKEIELLKNAEFPVCFVENEVINFNSVVVKNLEGGQLAAEFLYNKGYRNPGFIGEKTIRSYATSATEERLRGFSFFFANKGITISQNYIWVGEIEEELDKAIISFLEQEKLPDCVFCSSDVIAARFILFAREKNIRVPETIAVLGFDDIDISKYIGLSSVSQNTIESGKLAAELILEQINEPERIPREVVVPLEVKDRTTTGGHSKLY